MSEFFSLDQITCKEDLRVGMSIFVVDDSEYINEYVVIGEPYLHVGKTFKSIFLDVKYFNKWDKDFMVRNISLKDVGIIPNTYNKHRTFYTRESAEAFVANRKALGRIF